MVNYVEGLNGISYLKLCSAILHIYRKTGETNSKFFPLLNYAAREIVSADINPPDEIEEAALKWIDGNMPLAIHRDYCSNVRHGFAVNFLKAHGTAEENCVYINNTIFFNRALDTKSHSLMHDCNFNGYATKMLLHNCYPQLVESVLTMMSKDFQDALDVINSKIEALPDARRIMRHIKENAMSKMYEAKERPLADIIREHLRKDNSPEVIFIAKVKQDSDFHHDFLNYRPYVCHYHRESYTCTLFNDHNITAVHDMTRVYGVELNGNMGFVGMHMEGENLLRKTIGDMERLRNNFIK